MKVKKIIAPVVDYYKDLRFHNLTSRRYNHIIMALYWVLYEPGGGNWYGLLSRRHEIIPHPHLYFSLKTP